jgi:MarR family transcriptional regulator, negative regulator of the multidrug operon emrRAB
MQMNSANLEQLEANLKRLAQRVPEVPISGILMCRCILQLGREMAAMFEHQIRPFGLTEAEFRVLTTLYSQPNGVAHPTELCHSAAQSPANMSRIADALVSRELITRALSEDDRRRMVLRITEQGGALVHGLLPKMFAPLRQLLKDFPESDQRDLIDRLKRVGGLLDEFYGRPADADS